MSRKTELKNLLDLKILILFTENEISRIIRKMFIRNLL